MNKEVTDKSGMEGAMGKVTVSFTIEREQLARVDALAAELDRDRSSTLRRVIAEGIAQVRRERVLLARLSDGREVRDGVAQ